jgi:hypothetical protein
VYLRQLPFAAQKRRRRDRQVRVVERLEAREVAGSELVDALGGGELLEAVLPEIAETVGAGMAAGVAETSTWAPCPAAAMRAARCTSNATYLSSAIRGVPVCTPTRTCVGPSARRSVNVAAASRAPCALGNATKKASPAVSTSTPP